MVFLRGSLFLGWLINRVKKLFNKHLVIKETNLAVKIKKFKKEFIKD